jgi:hypothetical protein
MRVTFKGENPASPGERLLDVFRQPLHDALAPAFALLPLDDQPADVPVELDHLPVDGDGRLQLRRADPALEVFEQLRVPRRQSRV